MAIITQIVFMLMGAFLSVILTRIFIQNGKAITENGKKIDEGFKKMDERTEYVAKIAERIAELVVTESKETRKTIASLER